MTLGSVLLGSIGLLVMIFVSKFKKLMGIYYEVIESTRRHHEEEHIINGLLQTHDVATRDKALEVKR